MGKSLPRIRSPWGRRPKRRGLFFEPLEHRLLLDVQAAALADDFFEVHQNDDPQLLGVLDNDTFMAGYPGEQRITSVSYGSEGGRVEIAADGRSIEYAPPADGSETETFVYYVDNQLSATVTVTILSPLRSDEYEFPPDGQTRILDVLGNDPFWAGYDGPGKITSISETLLWGELEIAADGKSLVYTPPRDVYGKDTFVYIVDDLYPAEVRIEILDPLEPDRYPEIVQQSAHNVLNVLGNDPFWAGYPGNGKITHVTGVADGGRADIAADGKTLLYTPARDFAGWDHFNYVVDSVYEAPVSVQVHRPVQDDRFEVDRNTADYPWIVTENDTFRFWSGSTWITRDVIDRVTWVGETAEGGTVELMAGGQGILYSAPPDFEGTDSFDYLADGKHRATVKIDVTRPVRDDYFGSGVYEDTVNNTLDVLQNDFMGNGYQGPKIITSVSETSEGGTVTIAPGGRRLTYAPPADFRGIDTFSYTVDGELEAEVRVNVGSITTNDVYRPYPNPAQTTHVLRVLDNDHFEPNYPGPAVITSVGETDNGGLVTISADGQFLRFTPAEGGSDRFTYTVNGKYEASVSVLFHDFLRSDRYVVEQNSQANELDPLENDFRSHNSDGYLGPREISSVGPCEQGGTVTIGANGTTLTYAPAPDFYGTDRFTYAVDGLMRDVVTVNVIRRVRDDVFRVEADSRQNALPVLVNDLFGANYSGAGRVTAVTETGAGGTVVVDPNGASIDYTPPAGFTGEDTFTYTVDGALKAEVTVWVGSSLEEMLPRFDSLTDFGQFLLDDALDRYEHLFGSVLQYAPGPEISGRGSYFDGTTNSVGPTSQDSRSHSETNVQVEGVDEGDIIETDGDYLYILTDSELIIADAWPAEEMSIASRVAIEGELIAEYLHGDRVTVISKTWEDPWIRPCDGPGFRSDCWWPWPQDSDTWVTVFDVSDRASPTIVERTRLDGGYVQSRRIDDALFLVLRDDAVHQWLPEPELLPLDDAFVYETREQYIERVTAELENFLPHYTSYGADGELLQTGLLHAPESLFRPPGPDAGRLVTVVSMNVSDEVPGIVASTGIFTSGASEIYGSLDNLYVFDQRYNREDGTVTEILVFDWNAETGGVEFAAKGRVPGRMLNQFSADEYADHLRIATTIDNSYSGNFSGRSENVLFVLHNDGGVLEFVGSMQNLALGERIRSVRFMGERGFVTTFRDVDPLFALDLSDPARPQSRGHITMPGFNSYMQLIDENHILTVGRNTPVAHTGPTQVSLFDVEDISRPRLIDQYTFPRFSTSEAETDHHAFGWFAQHGVLSMPSARVYWDRVDEDGDGYSETRKLVREDELALFRIDVTATSLSGDGIQLLGEVVHDSPVRRSAFIEDVLYSVAENSACAVSIVDPNVQFAEIRYDDVPDASMFAGTWGPFGNGARILDDTEVGFHADGYWSAQPDQGYGNGLHFKQPGSGSDVASWNFAVTPGRYRVAATWSEYANRASNAPFTVLDGSTPLATVRLDQQSAPDDFTDEQTDWESLGVFEITGNLLVVTLSDDADDYVVADAIRVAPVPTIAGRHVFYHNSAFDDPTSPAAADEAIATDKTALLPGETASFANYTSYDRGINGIMVDILGMTDPSYITIDTLADYFEFRVGNTDDPGGWTPAPSPTAVTVRQGAGDRGSDRVMLTWPDNSIRNQWLEVTVLAADTGLEHDDVFYFGNAVAEAGNSGADARVTITDLLLARNNPRNFLNPAPIDSPYDYNRDQRVNVTDVLLARNNQTNFPAALRLIDLTDDEPAVTPAALPDSLAWLREIDFVHETNRSSDEPNAAADAVDSLLATYGL